LGLELIDEIEKDIQALLGRELPIVLPTRAIGLLVTRVLRYHALHPLYLTVLSWPLDRIASAGYCLPTLSLMLSGAVADS
jgi:hypothetical protein